MILLTGATGFLGSYILFDLLKKGYDVRALYRKGSSFRQVERVFTHFSKDQSAWKDRVEWVEGDIGDVFSLSDAMKGVETVIHCAGMVSFESRHRKMLMDINTEGTANVVNISLQEGVRKLMYISSIAALGRGSGEDVITEKTVWKTSRFNSGYAISKYGGEKEVWRGEEEGLEVCVLNPAMILGFGDPSLGTSRMFQTVHNGLRLYPCGMNGFVDVRDVSAATVALLQAGIHNERFILCAENLSYQTLFTLMAGVLGKKPPTIRVTPLIAGLAWRWESVRHALTSSRPLITRETAITSTHMYRYDGSKILSALPFTYTPVENSLRETGALLVSDRNL